MSTSRNKRRHGRIRGTVHMWELLAEYGYPIREGDHEQQFSCDLHGDGTDSKPSARFYPKSNSFYCWACGRTRDAVALVQEKEGLDYGPALSFLEKKLGLPEISDFEESVPEERTFDIPHNPEDYEVADRRARTILTVITKERALPLESTLKLWEAYDRVCSVKDTTPEVERSGLMMKVLLAAKGKYEGVYKVHAPRP